MAFAPFVAAAVLGVFVAGALFSRKRDAGWLFNRLAAAVTLAVLSALLNWVVVCLIAVAQHAQGLPTILTLGLAIACVCFAAPGTVATFAVLCASPAKVSPWRSLPFLLPGTTLAGLVVIAPFMFSQRAFEGQFLEPIAMWVIAVGFGGFAAAMLNARR